MINQIRKVTNREVTKTVKSNLSTDIIKGQRSDPDLKVIRFETEMAGCYEIWTNNKRLLASIGFASAAR